MRIWYVPPSYMDTATICGEIDYIYNFLVKLEKADSALYPDYQKQRGYLFLRLVMLEKEYHSRVPHFSYFYESFNANDYTLQDKPTQEIIWDSVKKLLLHWEQMFSKNIIIQYYDILNSKSAEDIYLEAEWLLELYRKEFGL